MESQKINPGGASALASTAVAASSPINAALWPFAFAIFLGAFLLFQVQPIIGRYILPWFGGAPGVWTACMLFFEVLLLCGYAYAHFSIQQLSRPMQAVTHLILLAVCVVVLHVTPAATWKPHTASEIANPTWRIVCLLAAHVGLPFFALSATGPLLQAWISRMNGGRSPYRLYALSNLGSLLALISYPFVFEPLLGRTMQANAWSWGMRGFVAACGCCAILAWRTGIAAGDEIPMAEVWKGQPSSRPHWVLWFVLPASASVLLLATTNKICQDIAVVPFLWVLPLALYLLSFVLTFDSERWYWRRTYMIALAIGLAGAIRLAFKSDHDVTALVTQIIIYSGVLFFACMIFHGELARLKPGTRHLTGFYLMIAAGGAAGGAFVAVVAPLIFSDYYELDIGMLLCCVLLPVTWFRDKSSVFHHGRMRFIWQLLAGVLISLGLSLQLHPLRPSSQSMAARYRSFYGVLSIYEYNRDNPAEHYFLLQHGAITHGLQYVDPLRCRTATSYYEAGSGVGLAMIKLAQEGPRHIGVVGLGTGTMAAYGRKGDRFRFYEINPQVEMIARKHFTYLSQCDAQVDVILGDARLSMEAEDAQAFDVLVLDAFSGDAIPVHLLTREAFQIYQRHMKANGVIAVHVSNQFLDLEPIVARIAEHFGLRATAVSYALADYPSDWVLVAMNPALLEGLQAEDSDISPARAKRAPLWTDDHTSLLPIVRGSAAISWP